MAAYGLHNCWIAEYGAGMNGFYSSQIFLGGSSPHNRRKGVLFVLDEPLGKNEFSHSYVTPYLAGPITLVSARPGLACLTTPGRGLDAFRYPQGTFEGRSQAESHCWVA